MRGIQQHNKYGYTKLTTTVKPVFLQSFLVKLKAQLMKKKVLMPTKFLKEKIDQKKKLLIIAGMVDLPIQIL